MNLFFGTLAVLFAALSFISWRLKPAILCYWGCSLCVGGLFLGMGLEFFAFLLWFVTTLITLSFLLYGIIIGLEIPEFTTDQKNLWIKRLIALIIGSGTAVLLWLGFQGEKIVFFPDTPAPVSLEELGGHLMDKHYAALILLLILLICTIIASGMVIRPEEETGES